MIDIAETVTRHTFESKILGNALRGDRKAVDTFLKYLSSANPHLCQIMQGTIHDQGDGPIWQFLLRCLALHRWDAGAGCERYSDSKSLKRIDQAIIEVFTQDEHAEEKSIKEEVLQDSLDNPESHIRHAAAYLLGLRGNPLAIPQLAEILVRDTKEWQRRAIKAFSVLKDERCGPPLLKILIEDRGDLHREASRALFRLGEESKSTWLRALHHSDRHVRWHAARALGELGDPTYAAILAEGLRDKDYAVRWATADVLAKLGERGVPATLHFLTHCKIDAPTLRAAYHALNGISSPQTRARIKPLLEALNSFASIHEAQAIAQTILIDWEAVKNDY